MLVCIRNAKTPKEDWENVKKIFATSTTSCKLQHRQELNNIRKKDMTVPDYNTKIKAIHDVVGSINVMMDEEEVVQIYVGGLA